MPSRIASLSFKVRVEAVSNNLTSAFTGPPGTGKTRTIVAISDVATSLHRRGIVIKCDVPYNVF